MQFSDTPIYNTLIEYLSKSPLRMHVPFHSGFPVCDFLPKEIFNLDISEVSGYDTEGTDNPIYQSEKITADFFSVKHSFYLTGSASSGLLATMIALNKFGKKVIVPRNVHKSVINGIILAGLEPIWLETDFLNEWGIFTKVIPEKLEEIISSNNNIAGCVVVSPTYEGIISDIKSISQICHKKNIPLIVDEAHGGHFYFLNEKSCFSSTQLGADLIIQSWHKSLGSLTQSGVLHLSNETYFSYLDIKRAIDLVSSTSPSFLLLISLELTRSYLSKNGKNIFSSLYEKACSLTDKIKNIKTLMLYPNDDPLKIYFKAKNITGTDFAYKLYKNHSIEVESANETGLLLIVGNNFSTESTNKIINSLNQVVNSAKSAVCNKNKRQDSVKISNIKLKLSPRDAFMTGFNKESFTESKINFEVTAPCPPGYAINIPGTEKE